MTRILCSSFLQFVSIVSMVLCLAGNVEAQVNNQMRNQARRPIPRRYVSQGPVSYYGEAFYQQVKEGMRNDQLRATLFTLLTSGHIPQPGHFDKIVDKCPAGVHCYYHRPLTYDQARQIMMGKLYLQKNGNMFFIHDVYCQHDYGGGHDFPRGELPGPMKIPDDRVLNTEHTWPQSRFSGKFDKNTQKTDLHHLFPADSVLNAVRSSFAFGDVTQEIKQNACPTSKFGRIAGANGYFFEPPADHKGNVARALFYFATRYQMKLDDVQESFLRKWNQQDPPDEAEIARNNAIYEIQGDRNPYVDHPELVGFINNF